MYTAKVYWSILSTCIQRVLVVLEEDRATYDLVDIDMRAGQHQSLTRLCYPAQLALRLQVCPEIREQDGAYAWGVLSARGLSGPIDASMYSILWGTSAANRRRIDWTNHYGPRTREHLPYSSYSRILVSAIYCLLKARCRFPDASVPVASVQRDIADLASNGAGGLQLVPFYYYGNPSDAPPLTDWRTFGFGTEAFRRLFEAALDAAVENNILMDFALGASQGQGTPAEPGTEGLSLQLVRDPCICEQNRTISVVVDALTKQQLGVTTINAGTQVTGPVPGPQNLTETLLSGGGFMHGLAGAEKGELKAVIAGRVISGLVTCCYARGFVVKSVTS
ncbi:unnamed protein product [Aspergillus oryzae]|nr:unnamed protein product [Aspergillus oryzae]